LAETLQSFFELALESVAQYQKQQLIKKKTTVKKQSFKEIHNELLKLGRSSDQAEPPNQPVVPPLV
jgi:hypothetical protein